MPPGARGTFGDFEIRNCADAVELPCVPNALPPTPRPPRPARRMARNHRFLSLPWLWALGRSRARVEGIRHVYSIPPPVLIPPPLPPPPPAFTVFGAMKAVPARVLGNRKLMQSFSLFSEPIIRLVDRIVGATNAMRVDAYGRDGRQASLET